VVNWVVSILPSVMLEAINWVASQALAVVNTNEGGGAVVRRRGRSQDG
jgi:hypothetical protein